VDDEIVLGMLRERLAAPDAKHGFILDGFPRNLAQAHALDALLAELRQPLDAVVQMDVESSELMRRISGRRTCADCGRVFNLFSAPAERIQSEVCPKTGSAHRLFQRPDDKEETVANRLKVYEEKTKPLIEFYRNKGVLQRIHAEGDVDEITRRLEAALRDAAATMFEKSRAAVKPGAPKRAARPKAKISQIRKSAAAGKSALKKRAVPKPLSVKKKSAKKAARKPASRTTFARPSAGRRSAARKPVRRARR
jgi:adenylate kinase